MSRFSVFRVLLVLGSLLLAAPVASQNILINGNLESEPNFGASNGTGCGSSGDTSCGALSGSQLPGWTIEPGHLVTVHIASGAYPTISGTYSINTDGEGFNGHNANFYQDFPSSSGQQYTLQYDWATWQAFNTSANLDVSVTDTVTSSVLYHANFVWSAGLHHISVGFTGTGNPLRLRVQELPESGTNDNAYLVDNFSVVASVSAPTGASAAIPTLSDAMLASLAGLLLFAGALAVRSTRR